MIFECKQFCVEQDSEVFKITTDATLLGALAWNDVDIYQENKHVLEFGAGTGIISLMLAQRFSNFKIEGIDINETAVKLSADNFKDSKFSDRLTSKFCDVREVDEKYDLIITNPPYFQNDTLSDKVVDKRSRHLEGLTYDKMIECLLGLIVAEGSIEMIHPVRYLGMIEEKVKELSCSVERVVKIRHHEEKEVRNCVTRIFKGESEKKVEYFEIREKGSGVFSKAYVGLLRPFINV